MNLASGKSCASVHHGFENWVGGFLVIRDPRYHRKPRIGAPKYVTRFERRGSWPVMSPHFFYFIARGDLDESPLEALTAWLTVSMSSAPRHLIGGATETKNFFRAATCAIQYSGVGHQVLLGNNRKVPSIVVNTGAGIISQSLQLLSDRSNLGNLGG
jgi:hypothetical protein